MKQSCTFSSVFLFIVNVSSLLMKGLMAYRSIFLYFIIHVVNATAVYHLIFLSLTTTMLLKRFNSLHELRISQELSFKNVFSHP